MFKRVVSFFTFILMLSVSLPQVEAAEYVFPQEFWGYLESFKTARESGNHDDILKYGQLIIDCFGNEESIQAYGNRKNSYEAFIDIYQEREDYDKTAEALREFLRCVQYLAENTDDKNVDAIKLKTAKLEHFKLNIDVYAETKNTAVVPYYGQKLEPRNGVYMGRVANKLNAEAPTNGGVDFTAEEGIVSFYMLFGRENLSIYDWMIQPFDDNSRVLHFAWNLYEENSGLQNVLSSSSDQHIIDTLRYINSLKSPTMLRIFAEMNVWEPVAEAQQYKEAYLKIARLARQYAPNTALIFAPNSISNWTVDISDYYPGDEYVDWVGVSLYSRQYFDPLNPEPREDYSEAYYFNGIYENPIVMLRDIVERYGSKKPIIITEGGSPHKITPSNIDTSASARKYIKQVYEYVSMVFPQVKATIYFDQSISGRGAEYILADNASVRDTYFNALRSNPAVTTKNAPTDTAYVTADKFNETTDSLNLATYAVFPSAKPTTVEYRVNDNLLTTATEIPYRASVAANSLSEGDNKLEVVVKNGAYSKKLEYTVVKSAGNITSCKSGYTASSTAVQNPIPNSPLTAKANEVQATVDGRATVFYAYNIQDNNYLKLRDLAAAINGTAKQFEVKWDGEKNAINLISNTPYTADGSEGKPLSGGDKTPVPTGADLYVDGVSRQLTVYNIDGSNYFKLRDIARLFDFGVGYEAGTVIISTAEGYTE